MGRVLPFVVAIALLVYAVIDCLQTDSGRIRSLPRWAWLTIIVLVPLFGPIAWLVAGKARTPRRPKPQPRRPLAPDDDPEFLRQLRETETKHEKMLGDWEADLRRREEELRRGGNDDEPEPRRKDDDSR